MSAIAELLRESLRTSRTHGIDQLLVGITSCRIEVTHCESHGPILPGPTDIRKASGRMWITSDGEENSSAHISTISHIRAGNAHEQHGEAVPSQCISPQFAPSHPHRPKNVDNTPLWRKGRRRSAPNATAHDSPLDTARPCPAGWSRRQQPDGHITATAS
jgi:hypothetical protein